MKINISKLQKVVVFGLFIQITCAVSVVSTAFAEDNKKQPPAKQRSIFPDKNLEKAVRKAVYAKRNNDEPITADDVKSISTIDGQRMGIKDLTGLEHCQALASLKLGGNQITNLAPISNLTRVQLLDVSDNKITDISPLGQMKGLQYINIENNRVTSLEPLKSLENVNSFYADGNQISVISPLFGLPKLWSIHVANNRLKDLRGISGVKRVDTFGLSGNQIADLDPLLKLVRTKQPRVSMMRVYLKGNPLETSKAKAQVAELKRLGLKLDIES